ncbi:MAG TPA: hypothetical protein DDY32_20300, partial [Desulfobulbaceae bacterium]|nr:hypothetical protein [Desulfobulbaceae bacterium]
MIDIATATAIATTTATGIVAVTGSIVINGRLSIDRITAGSIELFPPMSSVSLSAVGRSSIISVPTTAIPAPGMWWSRRRSGPGA